MSAEETIAKASARSRELSIEYAVVASNTGETVEKALGKFPRIIWVSHHFGYIKPGQFGYTQESKERLTQKGVAVLTTAHVLSGAERGLSSKFSGYGPVEIIAQALRMFGQGTKVCVEVATMALDAGLVPFGEKIIALGGTGRGADTALILTPANSSKILDTKIHEVICKPSL
ncbi:MAG: hypothetical protein LBO03_08395 [Acidaminococcales bacterium]|jgi:hypothetical protein|nr:hypothetical protein [Acidaminococcales bacterium]